MSSITRLSILKEMQDRAWYDALCYSANYGMTKPKEGYEAQWKEAKEKARLIDQMVKEQKEKEEMNNEVD